VQRTDILADKGAATREPALVAFRSSRRCRGRMEVKDRTHPQTSGFAPFVSRRRTGCSGSLSSILSVEPSRSPKT
jgi:hypothetical protein